MIDETLLVVSIIAVLFFIVLIVPLMKILVMVDLFGWDKTKELLRDNPDFGTYRSVNKKLKEAAEELKREEQQ